MLLMDEPTNHLDLESITALNNGLIDFDGTLIFTSHDHQFVQTIANRIIEITPNGIIDRIMPYDEYLESAEVKALRERMYPARIAGIIKAKAASLSRFSTKGCQPIFLKEMGKMSLLDKIKQSASDAAKKAQQTVEITKLKSQISGKEKDQDKLYYQIGTALYRSHQAGNVAESEQEVMGCCQQLDELQSDIQMIEERIRMIRFEKTCTCGKVVALDTKFCPDCGTQLPLEPESRLHSWGNTGDLQQVRDGK